VTARSAGRSRQVFNQPNRLQLRVFAEGKQTESIYLTNWHRLHRDKVIVSIAPHEHTTPFELAELAASERRSDQRQAKRGRGSAFNQYWCMFDVDEHPKVSEALDLARANSINIALSSPCLELWFLIHFDQQTAHLHRSDAQRKSRDLLGCDKVLSQVALDLLTSKYDTAKRHAQALAVKHLGDGSSKPWNPYSDVWELIDVIRTGNP
jgi:hypothetical protein